MKKLKINPGIFSNKYAFFAYISLIAAISACYYFFIYNDELSSKTTDTAQSENYKQDNPDQENNSSSATTPVSSPSSSINQSSSWPVILSYQQASSLTAVVNKKHKLPQDYKPKNFKPVSGIYLRTEAANAAVTLIDTAAKAGHNLKIISGYRSYSSQAVIYNNYVNQDGQSAADTYSARPGHSEHQTGLAVDFGNTSGYCDLEVCFGNTPAGKWLAANASVYGFVVRYPSGRENSTGYQYEPWHLRYLGIDTAKSVASSGKTLDEYFGIPAGGYQ